MLDVPLQESEKLGQNGKQTFSLLSVCIFFLLLAFRAHWKRMEGTRSVMGELSNYLQFEVVLPIEQPKSSALPGLIRVWKISKVGPGYFDGGLPSKTESAMQWKAMPNYLLTSCLEICVSCY